MYKLEPTYSCQDCDMDFKYPRLSVRKEHQCPYCGSGMIDTWYTCPGCGEEKLECDFTLDEFDLCRGCFEKEVKAMAQEKNSPARRQIIAFLKECS